MKRVVVNATQRRLHPGKAKVFGVTSIITAALCFMASDLVGQDIDPFAIRAETDLVLVHFVAPGSPVIPMSVKIPIESLPLGSHRLEIQVNDSAGTSTVRQGADFSIN